MGIFSQYTLQQFIGFVVLSAFAVGCSSTQAPAPVLQITRTVAPTPIVRDVPVTPTVIEVVENPQADVQSLPQSSVRLIKVPENNTRGAPTGATHTVVAGETVYRIGQNYNIDVEDILAFNPEIDTKYTIRPGQVVRLSSQGGQQNNTASASTKTPIVPPISAPTPKSSSVKVSSAATKQASGSAQDRRTETPKGAKYVMPLSGGKFVEQSGGYVVRGGGEVLAMADGRVVYIGNNLPNAKIGMLIEHEQNIFVTFVNFSSALVKSGDSVKQGQPVATSQNGSVGVVVRSKGVPIHPQKLFK